MKKLRFLQIETQIKAGFQKSLTRFYNVTDNPIKLAWDETMDEVKQNFAPNFFFNFYLFSRFSLKFHCCGINAKSQDFLKTPWRVHSMKRGENLAFPQKCCTSPPCTAENVYPVVS